MCPVVYFLLLPRVSVRRDCAACCFRRLHSMDRGVISLSESDQAISEQTFQQQSMGCHHQRQIAMKIWHFHMLSCQSLQS